MVEKIALGTAQLDTPYGINNQNQTPDLLRAQNILNYAYSQGIRYLDTARAYGQALERISENSQPFKVFSKFLASEQSIFDSLEEHRGLLKKQQLFCLSFHRFEDLMNFKGWSKVEERKKQQPFEIGVSVGSNDEALQAIQSGKVNWVQLPMNLLDNGLRKREVFQLASRAGIQLQIRSIYLQGLFFMNPCLLPVELKSLAKPLQRLQEVSAKRNLTVPELGLRYAYSFPEIQSITFGVDNPDQLKTNLKFINNGPLDTDLLTEIHSIKVKEPRLLNPAYWNIRKS